LVQKPTLLSSLLLAVVTLQLLFPVFLLSQSCSLALSALWKKAAFGDDVGVAGTCCRLLSAAGVVAATLSLLGAEGKRFFKRRFFSNSTPFALFLLELSSHFPFSVLGHQSMKGFSNKENCCQYSQL